MATAYLSLSLRRWRYGEVSGNPRWKGMAWGMMPSLGSAMCACTWHLFYNSPDLEVSTCGPFVGELPPWRGFSASGVGDQRGCKARAAGRERRWQQPALETGQAWADCSIAGSSSGAGRAHGSPGTAWEPK